MLVTKFIRVTNRPVYLPDHCLFACRHPVCMPPACVPAPLLPAASQYTCRWESACRQPVCLPPVCQQAARLFACHQPVCMHAV